MVLAFQGPVKPFAGVVIQGKTAILPDGFPPQIPRNCSHYLPVAGRQDTFDGDEFS